MSRLQNTKADILTVFAATLALPADTNYRLTVATHHLFCPKYSLKVSKVHTTSTKFDLRDWQFFNIDYALYGILPDDPKKTTSI